MGWQRSKIKGIENQPRPDAFWFYVPEKTAKNRIKDGCTNHVDVMNKAIESGEPVASGKYWYRFTQD